jgi:predicted nucleotidyltransferase
MPNESSRSAKISWPTRDREGIVASIQRALPKLKEALPIRRVVLFGSFANGRATAHSDVDLLVVYEAPPREDAFATIKKTLSIRGLEPHVYTEEEASTQQSQIERMTEDGILLYPRDGSSATNA